MDPFSQFRSQFDRLFNEMAGQLGGRGFGGGGWGGRGQYGGAEDVFGGGRQGMLDDFFQPRLGWGGESGRRGGESRSPFGGFLTGEQQGGGQLMSQQQGGGPLAQFGKDVQVQPINVDITETDKEFNISAEVPGIKREDIKLNCNDDANGTVLTISGEKKKEHKEERENYRRMERQYGRVARSLRLPQNADADKISAKYENGVLKVIVPKKQEALTQQSQQTSQQQPSTLGTSQQQLQQPLSSSQQQPFSSSQPSQPFSSQQQSQQQQGSNIPIGGSLSGKSRAE